MTGPHDHRHTVVLFDGEDGMDWVVPMSLTAAGCTNSIIASVSVDECHGTEDDHRKAAHELARQLREFADTIERAHP